MGVGFCLANLLGIQSPGHYREIGWCSARRKIGTVLDASLYEQAKAAARRRGISANAVIEEALKRYLSGTERLGSTVREARGSYRGSRRALRAVLHEDFYDVA